MTVRYGWCTWGLRWSLREVLVDAATPGRGADYIMSDLARNTRQIRTFWCPVGMHNHASSRRSEWPLLY
jgi:hypothetical protein